MGMVSTQGLGTAAALGVSLCHSEARLYKRPTQLGVGSSWRREQRRWRARGNRGRKRECPELVTRESVLGTGTRLFGDPLASFCLAAGNFFTEEDVNVMILLHDAFMCNPEEEGLRVLIGNR